MRTGALDGVLIWGNLDVSGNVNGLMLTNTRSSARGDLQRSDEASKRREPDDESLEKNV
jgi:hypothetical protein